MEKKNKDFGIEKTLKNWKFSDISLDGKPVKMYFFKSFVFQIDN